MFEVNKYSLTWSYSYKTLKTTQKCAPHPKKKKKKKKSKQAQIWTLGPSAILALNSRTLLFNHNTLTSQRPQVYDSIA